MKTTTLHKIRFLTIQRLMLICLVMIGGCGPEEDEHEEALQVETQKVKYTKSGVKFEFKRIKPDLTNGIPERYIIKLTNTTSESIDTTGYAIKVNAYKNGEPQKMRKDILCSYVYFGKKAKGMKWGEKISLKEIGIDKLLPSKTVIINLSTSHTKGNENKYDLPDGVVEVALCPPSQQPEVMSEPWECDEPVKFEQSNGVKVSLHPKAKILYGASSESPTHIAIWFHVSNNLKRLQSIEKFKVKARIYFASDIAIDKVAQDKYSFPYQHSEVNKCKALAPMDSCYLLVKIAIPENLRASIALKNGGYKYIFVQYCGVDDGTTYLWSPFKNDQDNIINPKAFLANHSSNVIDIQNVKRVKLENSKVQKVYRKEAKSGRFRHRRTMGRRPTITGTIKGLFGFGKDV